MMKHSLTFKFEIRYLYMIPDFVPFGRVVAGLHPVQHGVRADPVQSHPQPGQARGHPRPQSQDRLSTCHT